MLLIDYGCYGVVIGALNIICSIVPLVNMGDINPCYVVVETVVRFIAHKSKMILFVGQLI